MCGKIQGISKKKRLLWRNILIKCKSEAKNVRNKKNLKQNDELDSNAAMFL